MASLTQSLATTLDKIALAGLNRRLPKTFENSYGSTATLESILAQTRLALPMGEATAVRQQLFAGGYQPLYLETAAGLLRCGLDVYRSPNPAAPLLLYHHGFSEYPWNKNSNRLFDRPELFDAHIVRIQAPHHTNWSDPVRKGFASLESVYEMLAGSLRLMAFAHEQFQAEGAPFTVAAGVSWGGITSILYQATFEQARAVIPLFSAPNLARVLLDVADLFDRPINVDSLRLEKALDFTPYYEQCDADCIYPVLAENDLFFRLDHHAAVFAGRPLVTVPESHVTGCWRVETLRQHILSILERLQDDDQTE